VTSQATRAIVLKVVDFGESDRVVTLLSPELGKLAAVARGARSSRRRFSGIGLGVVGDAMVKERRGTELHMLESFTTTRTLAGAGVDVAALAHGGYLVELARELCPPHEPEPGVFALVEAALAALEAGPLSPAGLRRFELALLGILGLAPSLDRCAGCGGSDLDAPGQRFDSARGGVVCARCASGGLPLPGQARAYLVAAQQGLPAPAADAETAGFAREAVLSAIHAHLGKPLKSLEFITKLREAARP
jgi:DNA repair protein RecO (recombination protein O)